LQQVGCKVAEILRCDVEHCHGCGIFRRVFPLIRQREIPSFHAYFHKY
jgi:hypothetical protein